MWGGQNELKNASTAVSGSDRWRKRLERNDTNLKGRGKVDVNKVASRAGRWRPPYFKLECGRGYLGERERSHKFVRDHLRLKTPSVNLTLRPRTSISFQALGSTLNFARFPSVPVLSLWGGPTKLKGERLGQCV